jgi:hypothetical protein
MEHSQIPWTQVGRQRGELTELTERVKGLRAAAHKTRRQGNVTKAEALDATRFEVYQNSVDESNINDKTSQLLV